MSNESKNPDENESLDIKKSKTDKHNNDLKDAVRKSGKEVSSEVKAQSIASISAISSSISNLQKEVRKKVDGKDPSKSLKVSENSGSISGNKNIISGLEMTIKNLAKITSNMAGHVKTITVETGKGIKKAAISGAKTLKDGASQYARAISEDININKQNFMVTTLGKISPLVGYAIAKILDTQVFQDMITKIKDKFSDMMSTLGNKFKSMLSTGWEKTKAGTSFLIDKIKNIKEKYSKPKNETSKSIHKSVNDNTKSEKRKLLSKKELIKQVHKSANDNTKSEHKKGIKSIPHLAKGGLVTKDGIVKVHAGEVVQPVNKIIKTILNKTDHKIQDQRINKIENTNVIEKTLIESRDILRKIKNILKENNQNKKSGILKSTKLKSTKKGGNVFDQALSNSKDILNENIKSSKLGIKQMFDIIQRRSMRLESHVRHGDDKIKKGIIKSFFDAYKDETQSHLWSWQDRVLKELIALRESWGATTNEMSAVIGRVLHEHPIFRQFVGMTKLFKGALVGGPKFLFKKRGGFEGDLPNSKEPLHNMVSIAGMTYALLGRELQQISGTNQKLLTTSVIHTKLLSGEDESGALAKIADSSKNWTIGGKILRMIKAPFELSLNKIFKEKKSLAKRTISGAKSIGGQVLRPIKSLGRLSKAAVIGGAQGSLQMVKDAKKKIFGEKKGPGFISKSISKVKKGIGAIKDVFTGTYQRVKNASIKSLPLRMQHQLGLMERARIESTKEKAKEEARKVSNVKKTMPELLQMIVNINEKILEKLSVFSDSATPIYKTMSSKLPLYKNYIDTEWSTNSPKKLLENKSQKLLAESSVVEKKILSSQIKLISIGNKTEDINKRGFQRSETKLSQIKSIGKRQIEKLKEKYLLARKDYRMSERMSRGINKLNKKMSKSSSFLMELLMGAGSLIAKLPGMLMGMIGTPIIAAIAGLGLLFGKKLFKLGKFLMGGLGKLFMKIPGLKGLLGKTGAKTGAKIAAKAGTKSIGKIAGKTLFKSALKKLPILGLAAGVGFALHRLAKGDLVGAGMELSSGAMGATGVGFLGSVGMDAAILARDIKIGKEKASLEEKAKEAIKKIKDKTPEILAGSVGSAEELKEKAKKGIESGKDYIKEKYGQLKEYSKEKYGQLKEKAKKGIESGKDYSKDKYKQLKDKVLKWNESEKKSSKIESGKDYIKEKYGQLKEYSKEKYKQLKDYANKVYDKIVNFIKIILTSIKNGIKKISTLANNFYQNNFGDHYKNKFDKGFDKYNSLKNNNVNKIPYQNPNRISNNSHMIDRYNIKDKYKEFQILMDRKQKNNQDEIEQLKKKLKESREWSDSRISEIKKWSSDNSKRSLKESRKWSSDNLDRKQRIKLLEKARYADKNIRDASNDPSSILGKIKKMFGMKVKETNIQQAMREFKENKESGKETSKRKYEWKTKREAQDAHEAGINTYGGLIKHGTTQGSKKLLNFGMQGGVLGKLLNKKQTDEEKDVSLKTFSEIIGSGLKKSVKDISKFMMGGGLAGVAIRAGRDKDNPDQAGYIDRMMGQTTKSRRNKRLRGELKKLQEKQGLDKGRSTSSGLYEEQGFFSKLFGNKKLTKYEAYEKEKKKKMKDKNSWWKTILPDDEKIQKLGNKGNKTFNFQKNKLDNIGKEKDGSGLFARIKAKLFGKSTDTEDTPGMISSLFGNTEKGNKDKRLRNKLAELKKKQGLDEGRSTSSGLYEKQGFFSKLLGFKKDKMLTDYEKNKIAEKEKKQGMFKTWGNKISKGYDNVSSYFGFGKKKKKEGLDKYERSSPVRKNESAAMKAWRITKAKMKKQYGDDTYTRPERQIDPKIEYKRSTTKYSAFTKKQIDPKSVYKKPKKTMGPSRIFDSRQKHYDLKQTAKFGAQSDINNTKVHTSIEKLGEYIRSSSDKNSESSMKIVNVLSANVDKSIKSASSQNNSENQDKSRSSINNEYMMQILTGEIS